MEPAGIGGTASLGELFDSFKRRWWMVALGAVIGVALASAYLLVAPKTYLATATVLVAPVGGVTDNVVDNARTNSGVNLDTEAQLVRSQAVSARAKVKLETKEIVGQLIKDVSVNVPPNTNVLRISYEDPTPEGAATGASAFANAYLDNRRDTAADAIDTQIKELRQQSTQLQLQLTNASGVDREVAREELKTVNFRLNSLVGTAVVAGNVISDSLVPRRPESPNQTMVLFTGLALGILIGILGVVFTERRDGRTYDWRVLERRLGLPVLSNIPGRRLDTPQLHPVHSPAGQAYTQLRNVLLNGLPNGGVVVVAEPEQGGGADDVAANLGAAFARGDRRTALVVADSDSSVAAMFNVAQGPGLSGVLQNRHVLTEVAQEVVAISGLTVIPPGTQLNTDVQDLDGAGVEGVLRQLRERSDIVVVKARATTTGADAQMLGRHSDIAVVVVELGSSRRESVASAVRQWSIVGTPVAGAVTVPTLSEGPEPVLVTSRATAVSGDRLTRAPAAH